MIFNGNIPEMSQRRDWEMYGVRLPMCLPRAPGCFCRLKGPWNCSGPDLGLCGPGASNREGKKVFGSGTAEQLAAGKADGIFGNC